MTYPNAYTGVKRLFNAHLLMLIAAVLIVGAVIFIMVSQGFITKDGINTEALETFFGNEENYSKIVTPGIFLIIGIILALIAFIMLVIGLVHAGRDESAFKLALLVLVVGVVISVIISILENNKPELGLSRYSDIISTVASLLVELFIAMGVMSLATRLNDSAMYDRGKPIKLLYIVAIILSVVTFLCGLFIKSEGVLNIVQYVEYFTNLVVFVAFIMMLVYLAKAKRMLQTK